MKQVCRIATVFAALLTLVVVPAAYAFPPSYMSVDGDTTIGIVSVDGATTSPIVLQSNWGVQAVCPPPIELETRIARGAIVVPTSKIGVIDKVDDFVCTFGSVPADVEAQVGASGWEIYANETPTALGVPFSIVARDVGFYVHTAGAPCEFLAEGVDVEGTFVPGSGGVDGWIEFDGGFALEVTAFDGSGTRTPSSSGATCGGQIYDGDLFSITGDFELSTAGFSPGTISHD